MEEEFEILEKGDSHFVAEVGDETYLVEDQGLDSEQGVYTFSVGDGDTVYGSDGDFATPDEVRILESEADSFSSYEKAAEAVLERGVMGGGKESLEGLNQFY